MRNLNLLFLLPALAFLSCSDEQLTPETSEEQFVYTNLEANVELAFPDEIGMVSTYYYAGQKLLLEEVNGEFVYEGDIMFSPDMLTNKEEQLVYQPGEKVSEKSVGRTAGRWPNNTVFYAIDPNLSGQTRVTDAIKHWESNTNIKFVQRTSQSNYINFTTGTGCSSYVGMIGGKQNITLSTSCTTGSTIHEIGHAIGLWHEQSRVDRSNHIVINYDNIQTGREHNFQTYLESGADGKEFTSILDFGSIMMYGSYSFSKNGLPTIVKTNGSTYSVQRSSLSTGDKEGINGMYPSGTAEPTYINGEYYTIAGLTVLRYNDLWYLRTRFGFKRVELINDRWYWV